MKGCNTLTLNQDTLVEALQEYLAKRYTPTPIVKSVKQDTQAYGSGLFSVEVEEAPKETDK